MIYRINQSDSDDFEKMIPVFKIYLNYMSRYYDIKNIKAWQEKAVKNLEQNIAGEDYQVYVLKNNGEIIGFTMVNKHLRFNSSGQAIAEFYIQKDHEKKGYGRKMAEYVFSQFKGQWEVSVSAHNESALRFWKKVISSYTSDDYITETKLVISDYGFLFNRKTA